MNNQTENPLRVYTFGYQSHRSVVDLLRVVKELDAIVCDVRFRPWSKEPQWRQETLRQVLGSRYHWCQGLGNRNYRGTTIELVDFEAGLEKVVRLGQETGAVILLCGCWSLESCHRKVVAERIAERIPATIVHLTRERRV